MFISWLLLLLLGIELRTVHKTSNDNIVAATRVVGSIRCGITAAITADAIWSWRMDIRGRRIAAWRLFLLSAHQMLAAIGGSHTIRTVRHAAIAAY